MAVEIVDYWTKVTDVSEESHLVLVPGSLSTQAVRREYSGRVCIDDPIETPA